MKVVIFLAGLVGFSWQAEWSYDSESDWGGVCRAGTLQSPVNIESRRALLDLQRAHIRGPLLLRQYTRSLPLTATNNGHTLQWSTVKGGAAPVLAGGPLRTNYTFAQLHLHWLSEHAIDGIKYPLEIHLVHIQTGLTMAEATRRPDGLAVIAVLGEVRSEEDSTRALADIMPAVPLLREKTDSPTEPMSVNLLRLVSARPQSYYTYRGSLTTPDCAEAVVWIVMDVPIHVSDTQYKELSRVDVGGVDNYRSVQELGARAVYRSHASCRPAALPGVLAALAGLLHCLPAAAALPALARRALCLLWDAKRNYTSRGHKHINICEH